MAFNLGAFAGGLAHGWDRGVKMANDYRAARDRNAIEEASRNGLDGAKKQREADITGQIQSSNVYDEASDTNMNTYKVNGQTYSDAATARQEAEKNVGSEQSYFAKSAVPFFREAYIKMGRPDLADKWTEYGQQQEGRDAISTLGNALKYATVGDHSKAGKYFGEYYNKFIDDGVDYQAHTVTKDEKGNQTGYLFTLKKKDSDELIRQPVSISDMLNLANTYSPTKLFEEKYAQHQAAISASVKRAEKDYEAAQKDSYDALNEQRKFRYTLGEKREASKLKREETQEENNLSMNRDAYLSGLRVNEEGAKVSARSNAITGVLRGMGYGDAELKAMGPQILKMHDNYKLTTSPSERASIMLSKDFSFSSLPMAEQRKKLQETAEMFRQLDASEGPETGLPAPSSSMGGSLIYDPRTGKIR